MGKIKLRKARFKSIDKRYGRMGPWNEIMAPFPIPSITAVNTYVNEVIMETKDFRIDHRLKVSVLPTWYKYQRILNSMTWEIEYAMSNGEWMGDYLDSAHRIANAHAHAGVIDRVDPIKFAHNIGKIAKLIFTNLVAQGTVENDIKQIREAKCRSA